MLKAIYEKLGADLGIGISTTYDKITGIIINSEKFEFIYLRVPGGESTGYKLINYSVEWLEPE